MILIFLNLWISSLKAALEERDGEEVYLKSVLKWEMEKACKVSIQENLFQYQNIIQIDEMGGKYKVDSPGALVIS